MRYKSRMNFRCWNNALRKMKRAKSFSQRRSNCEEGEDMCINSQRWAVYTFIHHRSVSYSIDSLSLEQHESPIWSTALVLDYLDKWLENRSGSASQGNFSLSLGWIRSTAECVCLKLEKVNKELGVARIESPTIIHLTASKHTAYTRAIWY
jgi:hypothetical protein